MNFSIIDFLIGLTLINTIPHFVLGIWKGRMFSGLGFGNTQNILYGVLNLVISICLFVYKYGFEGMIQNSMYLGALFVIFSYFIVGNICYTYFHKKYYSRQA
ncbi:hypothetical protein [Dokdonia pacifica]|uniref:PQ loop repeat-containing protein n=1 Tax=Dokdonia pacifica TaxID=1627892 RepID=A0A238ZFT2_9FLAO|nr:hypothetical protein [Dokdonia pacifica]SNR81989.1 hypothetical protein SAMN06265376_103182 [Dokdonia pacifica]